MCKVSIIVPVYNVAPYLEECLKHLVSQTMQDLEIIAVNDGSTDQSLEILKKYEQQYGEKITVYSIENHGVSYARNYGADRANGEYFLFVDSDDYMEADMCEQLYAKAKADHNDMVLCGKVDFYDNDDGSFTEREDLLLHTSQNFTIAEKPFELCRITTFPWDKLIRKELFEKVRFPENVRFEDLEWVLKMVCLAENIGVVNKPFYHYRRTSKGGFLNTFSEETFDVLKTLKNVLDYMEEKGLYKQYEEELAYICVRHLIRRYPALYRSRQQDLQLKKRMIKETHRFLDINFPKWKRNWYVNHYLNGKIKKVLFLCKNKTLLLIAVYIYQYMPHK